MMSPIQRIGLAIAFVLAALTFTPAQATEFTRTVPGTGVQLPDEYPEAGGVAIVLTGANGNIYYQFSDPAGAFRGFQFRGDPSRFNGNPFTINDPISLDCGFRSCTEYFGGSIARIDVRFSAFDGDTQVGGFDFNDITLRINGFDVGNWSGRTTDITNDDGTTSFGLVNGFGNNTFNTGWFSSTNPALLSSILSTNQTLAQVFDRDPNDNFWDFRRGPSLPQERLRTIAPGIEFEKSVDNGVTTFAAVGDVIDYTYVVRNIGSVDIDNISVVDDRIPNVDCGTNRTLTAVPAGSPAPNSLTCTASYTITQADIDAGEVTNVARGNGDPAFGQLGEVVDTATVTGPTRASAITLDKVGSPDPFGAVNTPVTYTLTVTNTGNTTLTNVLVTDPRLPTLSCSFASIPPAGAGEGPNTRTCSADYTVRQVDVDAFAVSGTLLRNEALVEGDGPEQSVSDTAVEELPGQPAAPMMTVAKTALQADFDAEGDVVNFRIAVRNTGNVTWPGPPTLTDTLDGANVPTTCPAGSVAPGATVTCTASYTIQQKDLDAGGITNLAVANITVGGQSAPPAQDDVFVPADTQTGLTIVKRLQAGSPDPYDTIGQQLIYEYVLTNTGTVTLSVPANAVTDDLVGVTCPTGDLAPGDDRICTSAAYVIDQGDLDDGSVTNTASASVTDPQGDPVTSDETELTVDADRDPALTMVKTAPPVAPIDFVDGLVVTYSYEVSNTGNVTIPGPILVSDDRIAGGPFECSPGSLAIGADITCTADYTVTVQDAGNGFVTNNASASGSDGTRSPTDSETIPQDGTPALTLAKVATTASFDATSDELTYDFTITNTGDVILNTTGNPIRLVDPDATIDPGCVIPAPGLLYPVGSANTPQSFTCTGRVNTLDQGDIDAGSFTNTAVAEFDYTPPGGGPVQTIRSGPSSATVPVDITPAFTFSKSSTDSFANVGDPVSYTLSVTNETNQTLSTVTITDPLIPGFTCELTDVGPMAVVQCPTPAVYTVDQDDLDRGFINNTATAEATSPTGIELTRTDTETVNIDPAAQTRVLSFAKTANPATFTGPGEDIDYTLAVTNDGNLTLRNILVDDTDLGLTCTIPQLAPGMTDTSCVGTRTTTQDDVDTGSYRNDAVASADGVGPVPGFAEITGPARNADFTFTKVADRPAFAAPGERVRFTLRLENTGNVTIRNIVLTDALFTPTLTCNVPELAPGQVDTSCFGTFQVGQEEVDAGFVENMASFVGTGADGTGLSDTATVRVPGPAAMPGLTVDKREATLPSPDGAFALNVTETYEFTVTNTGNVTLTGVSITDPLTAFTCTLADLPPSTTTTVCGDGTPLRTTYTPDQGDVDTGAIINTVTARGTPPSGPEIVAEDVQTLGGPDQLPELALTKRSTGGAGFTAIGDTLTYEYDVRNDGNVTLTAPITIADNRVSVVCDPIPAGGLAPGATLTCTATDRVDQDDLDLGRVDNTATASISQPVVPSSTYPNGVANVDSAPDTEQVLAGQNPSISLLKRIRPGTMTTFDGPGDLGDPTNPNNLIYEFVVTNDGNVTLTEPVIVTDANIPATLTCDPDGLAVGESAICSVTWAPGQPDVDLGFFDNTATADTTFVNEAGTTVPVSDTDDLRVRALQQPSMTLGKAFVSLTNNNTFGLNQTATYRFTITNTGNTTLSGPFVVDDNFIGTFTCLTADLAPGTSDTCDATYVVTQADVDLGSITNVADAVDDDGVRTPLVSETIPEDVNPALTLTKTADTTEITMAGQTIRYTYVVENTSEGAVVPSFSDPIIVFDDRAPGPINCTPANPLLVGQSTTCFFDYTVTQDDLDRVGPGLADGFVQNSARGETEFGGRTVVSNSDSVTVPGAPANASIETLKSFVNDTNPAGPAAVGDQLTFTVTVTNTGERTVSGILVTDPLIPNLTCDVAAPIDLLPDDVTTCTGTYVVTQDNVDDQSLTNTVLAEGSGPDGMVISDGDTVIVPLAPDAPLLRVTKTLVPQPQSAPGVDFTDPGTILQFRITVENIGNITVDDIEVTDSLVPGTCTTAGTLAPGESDNSCLFEYEVTQQNVDDRMVSNTATANGTPRNGTLDPASDTEEATGPDPEPGVGISKVGTGPLPGGGFDEEGQTISYVYTVVNQGNVTLNFLPVLTDDRIDTVTCDPLPARGLFPSETLICRADYVVDQDDVDAGEVTNIVDVEVQNEFGPNPITAQTTETVSGDRTPSYELSKVPSSTGPVVVDQVITYTYTVTNTGNVRLRNVTLDDQHSSAAGTNPLAISSGGTIAVLEPDEVVELTATYTVTQDDVDAQVPLTNLVSATATPPPGTTVVDQADDATVAVDPGTGTLEVIKTATTVPADLAEGSVITFTVTVANTGNVTLTDVVPVDEVTRNGDATPLPTNPTLVLRSGDNGVSGTLEVGETWVYTVDYTLTQEDVDAGGITNSVTVDALDPQDNPVSDVSNNGAAGGDDPTPIAVDERPGLEVLKTIRTPANARPEAGDVVIFEVTARNTGNVTLDAVMLTEDLRRADNVAVTTQPVPIFETGDAGIADAIDVGEIWTYRVEYVLEQADIDAGGLSNSITVDAETPTNTPVEDVSDTGSGDGDDPTLVDLTPVGALEVLKTVRTPAPARPEVGDVVVFEVTVENTGNVTLDAIALTEDLRRADDDPVTTQPVPIFESGDAGTADALDVGETWTYRVEYTLEQADLDAGGLTNSVTVDAETPANDPVSDVSDTGGGDGDDATPLPLNPEPSIEAIKTLVSTVPATPVVGDIILFEIAVQNTGNVTLDAPAFDEQLIPNGGAPADPAPVPVFDRGDTDDDGSLSVGETWVYEVEHALRQIDIDAGGLTNQVFVTTTDPFDTEVDDTSDDDGAGDDPTEVTLPQVPGIAATKVVLTPGAVSGDTILFEVTATNTGNTTLTAVTVSDDVLTRADATPLALSTGPDFVSNNLGSVEGTLIPGEVARFRATYVLTQDDVDGGGVSNVATVSGTPPNGGPVQTDPSDPAEVLIAPEPSLTMVKRLTSGQASVSAPDTVLTYAFDVTNTGNVTSGPIVVSDPLIEDAGGAITCPVTILGPDESTTCTGSYTVTQADIDDPSGEVLNVATLSDGTADPVTDDVAVPVTMTPALTLLKEGVSVTVGGTTFPGVPSERFVVGAVVTYDFTVTNAGNTTIRASAADPLTVTDNLIGTFDCLTTDLAPTESGVCQASFTVTVDDVDLGSLTNLATASDGETDSPQTSETVPAGADPALTIAKSLAAVTDAAGAPKAAFDTVGDLLVYDFAVTNSGRASLVRDVFVEDALLDAPLLCFASTTADPDLIPGETIGCSASYAITQADLDAGQVLNTATAMTTFGTGDREVTSPPDSVTTDAGGAPGLSLDKSAATLPLTGVGQQVTYTLRATNTGNRTLSRVAVTDPLLPGLSCAAATLDPGEVLECADIYTVTQDDIDAGEVINTADARAIDPQGNGVAADARLVLDTPAAAPAIDLVKTASPEPFGPDGSSIEYRFAVENTGNVTLTNVVVTDAIVSPPFTCTIPRLAVGSTDATTCILGYTVTQDDVDAGEILNEARVSADGPRGTTAEDTASVATDGTIAAPAIRAVKTGVLVGDAAAGSVIDYTLTVTNPGNVSLAVTGITDTLTRADGTPLTLDAPFALVAGDTNGNDRLDLTETWTYTAAYTLVQDDVDAGGVQNVARVDGESRLGAPVSDLADDGDDGDGNTMDDPTVTDLIADPQIEAIKTLVSVGSNAGDEVVFNVAVSNIGNVSLTDPAFVDVMTNGEGTDVSAGVSAAVLIGGSDTPLSPGTTANYELRYVLTQEDVDSGSLSNSVTVDAAPPVGPRVDDVSDNGGGDGDDPTEVVIEALPAATLLKTAGDPVRVGATLYEVVFTLTAENTGNVTLEGLTLIDDLAAFADPAAVVSVSGLTGTGFVTGGVDPGFDGVGQTETLLPDTALSPGETGVVSFTVRLDAADGSPAQDNVATLGADLLPARVAAAAAVAPIAPAGLQASKSVTPGTAILGDVVTYTIEVENTGTFGETGLTLVDELPAGLVPVPGSGRIDGGIVPAEVVAGRVVTWTPLSLAAGARVVATLQVRVTEGPGSFVNRAYMRGPTGLTLSNVAEATLVVRPEAVFDCGDVIGRVFDDVNLNGYYDGADPGEPREDGVTDQTFDAGKGGSAPRVRDEKGLPRARLATVDGTIITTDEFGRFNVPCAALPRDIGSNFTLKLDPSSLPTGYHMTTENPRTIRLTPGTLAKMNFGAALADVVDIALTAQAFPGGAPSDGLRQGVARFVAGLDDEPVVLRLTYTDGGEGQQAARSRLDSVEALIRQAWPRGRPRPVIERTIAGGR